MDEAELPELTEWFCQRNKGRQVQSSIRVAKESRGLLSSDCRANRPHLGLCPEANVPLQGRQGDRHSSRVEAKNPALLSNRDGYLLELGSGEYWAGDFTMNLNSFFNSMGNSRLLPKLPLWGEMQFEGSAYLGLGVLALTAVCLVLLIRKRGFSLRRHPRRIAMLILGAVLVAVSVFPTFAFGDQLLIRIPLSRRMNNLLGIFRSNGRFIWPVIYIIIFSAGRFLERQSARFITIICALALALQAFDYSAWMMKKHDKYGDAQSRIFIIVFITPQSC